MHLIPCPIQEPGIDEDHALGGCIDAGFQVDCGATLFIHDAHFDGMTRKPKEVFNRAKQTIGKCHFFGAVHFWLHNVDRAGPRVLVFCPF